MYLRANTLSKSDVETDKQILDADQSQEANVVDDEGQVLGSLDLLQAIAGIARPEMQGNSEARYK